MNKTTLTIIIILLLATTARSSTQVGTTDRQLQEVVVMGGKHKLRNLTSRDICIPGAVSIFTPNRVGCEVGTALSTKHRFEVEEITFDIVSNNIDSATLCIQIYHESTLTPLLPCSLLVSIPEGKKQFSTATLTEHTLLEPGDYIVAITFADCDESAKQQWSNHGQWDSQTRHQMQRESSIQFPLYMKNGYMRNSTTETFERCPVNIGLKVKGKRL